MKLATVTERLILLPGLGADSRQFDPQRAVFTNLHSLRWPPHAEDDTLATYARRIAPLVQPIAPYCLGGSSFGGMIAQELATLLDPPPRAVFLVGSARTGHEVAPHLRYFGQFATLFPQRVFEAGQKLTSLYASKFGRLTPEQKDFLAAMVADTVPAFVRWGIGAIVAWPGVGELPMPVHHIHGADDELIPVKRVRADVVVPGAGHLVNVTHADAVNRFIAERLPAGE